MKIYLNNIEHKVYSEYKRLNEQQSTNSEPPLLYPDKNQSFRRILDENWTKEG